ncbi:MAG: ATP-binding protein, partial [Quisquiliibacterium sp.]
MLGKEPIFALIDPSGFNNAILNLVINARDALGNDTQLGQIVVSAGRGHVQQNNSLGLVPGDYALVEVTDNGPGMPAHVLSQAFDPFFTTKERGRGTGLG